MSPSIMTFIIMLLNKMPHRKMSLDIMILKNTSFNRMVRRVMTIGLLSRMILSIMACSKFHSASWYSA